MISRDGIATSLWQDGVSEYKSKTTTIGNELYDVVIAGGGITGVTTALLLQEAGLKCILLEARTLCFGTTGGTTAHLNNIMDTPYSTIATNFGQDAAVLLAQFAGDAIDLIAGNIGKYGIDCGFQPATAFLFSQTKEQTEELEEIRKSSMAAGIAMEYAPSIPVPLKMKKALAIPGQAKFHPTRYVHGLARAFEKAGGVIIQHCRVLSAESDDGVTVETEQGTVRGGILIYATHIPPGINFLNTRCAPYRTYAMAVELEDDKYPDSLIYDMYDPYHYYRTQEVDGKKYFIAGGEDHKTGHVENTESCFLKLESHIRAHFRVKEIAYRWSSQYFEPVDGLPYIGHLPGHANTLVATGFGGNGMIYSNIAALLFKELLLKEPEKYTTLFNPNRIKPIAGFTNFVKENADVVRQLAGRLLPTDKLSEFADLAPGEGRIVKMDGTTMALYKDESGILYAVDPICKHMGCEVSFNAVERSWDCPCHGARYAIDGSVLTGPAATGLTKIDLTVDQSESSQKK